MKIGVIGLGKLGCPMAVGFALKQHRVIGYDKNEQRMDWKWFEEKEQSPDDKPIKEHLKDGVIEYGGLKEALDCDITFVAVETPNETGYDGTVPMPMEFKNYNLKPLRRCLEEIMLELILAKEEKKKNLCVISTVLPGTFFEMLAGLELSQDVESGWRWEDHVAFVHNPQFCAMGTVIPDLYNPEFVLLGYDGNPLDENLSAVCEFYSTISDANQYVVNVDEACMAKTCYNGWITSKIDYANAMMELAYKVPATIDIDRVTQTLAAATNRLWNGERYTYGGMGDGGGCHPKENLALAYLADKVGLSFNWWKMNMRCREEQAAWLADIVCAQKRDNPEKQIFLCGIEFKPETNLLDGSPALLLDNILYRRGHKCIKLFYGDDVKKDFAPSIFVITCAHEKWIDTEWPQGSFVIDPFRYLPEQKGVNIIRLGGGKRSYSI